MSVHGFCLFDTSLGRCGIAWSVAGVACVLLPGRNDEETRSGLKTRCAGAAEQAPPAGVGAAIAGIRRLLDGERGDLSQIALDLTGVPDFDRRVFEVIRATRAGETLTYGEVAARLGNPGLARAVGQALGRNPLPIVVPCHRVLAAGGRPGGFSAPGGLTTKRRLLEIEQGRGLQPTLPWG
jgi:methylated-DNA-[protein]-cysteine S-methyltransferase